MCRLQRPSARCSNVVAQQQRHDSEGMQAYNLRLREASGSARLIQALPTAAVCSQIMAPVQVFSAVTCLYEAFCISVLAPCIAGTDEDVFSGAASGRRQRHPSR